MIQRRQHVDVVVPSLDLGRADKDAGNFAKALHVESCLEARDLAPVAVSPHRYRQGAVAPLVAHGRRGLRHSAGSIRRTFQRPASRLSVAPRVRPSKPEVIEQVRDGGGLATRHDQCLDALELLEGANLDDVYAQASESTVTCSSTSPWSARTPTRRTTNRAQPNVARVRRSPTPSSLRLVPWRPSPRHSGLRSAWSLRRSLGPCARDPHS